MRPCCDAEGAEGDGAAGAVDREGAVDRAEVEDRRVEAAGGLDEDVGEAGHQELGGVGVGPDRQAGAAVLHDGAEVVDAVDVVGVRVGEGDAVEEAGVGGEELGAQVGGGVDEGAGGARRGGALEEEGAAAAAVLRVRRVAVAPVAADAGDAGGGAAAEDSGGEAGGHGKALGRLDFLGLETGWKVAGIRLAIWLHGCAGGGESAL